MRLSAGEKQARPHVPAGVFISSRRVEVRRVAFRLHPGRRRECRISGVHNVTCLSLTPNFSPAQTPVLQGVMPPLVDKGGGSRPDFDIRASGEGQLLSFGKTTSQMTRCGDNRVTNRGQSRPQQSSPIQPLYSAGIGSRSTRSHSKDARAIRPTPFLRWTYANLASTGDRPMSTTRS